MKKIFYGLLGLLAASCNTNSSSQQSGAGSDTTQIEVAETADDAVKRSDYRFTYSFPQEADGTYASIAVKGWTDGTEPAFECCCEFVEARNEKPDGEGWISESDINFDGIPDLSIYLGLQAYGQVASFYDAYVWNPETSEFDHVDIFSSIGEPLIDAENHCITSSGRCGPDHFVTQKYEWKDGELVLTEEKTEKIEWEDEEN